MAGGPTWRRRPRLDVLQAVERFVEHASVVAALRPVSDVGLWYLKLGEPTPSLSGGESQRLRIASRLRSSQDGSLYVFDEPTTACTRSTWPPLLACSTVCWKPGPRSSRLTTTLTCSLRPITSSTWARVDAPTADASWLPARPKTSYALRTA